jgi:hypothetical protein
MASKERIMTIIGGNSIDHENNNQKKNYFRRVNSISIEGPYKKIRWSHLPITFSEKRFVTERLSTHGCNGS